MFLNLCNALQLRLRIFQNVTVSAIGKGREVKAVTIKTGMRAGEGAELVGGD